MKILSIDSSAVAASVAICEDTTLLAEYTLNNGNTHSETILPMVESALSMLGLSVSDIDLFAVSNGPGSFTGVRIGTATVKGLAFGSSRPCVGVSTLEALAYNLVGYKGAICPVMNARRSQVYTALFESDGERLTRVIEDTPMSISELDGVLSELGEAVRFCGDGYDVTVPNLKSCKFISVPERERVQSAYSVAVVALEKYKSGEYTNDKDLVSTYLRPSQAERERNERLMSESLK